MNAARFIDFLEALLDSVPGKVFLIVDGHPVHRQEGQRVVREKAERRLTYSSCRLLARAKSDDWVPNNMNNDRIGRESS